MWQSGNGSKTAMVYGRIIRMRLCLRGFIDTEALPLDTFSGTAKRASQRILASEAACHPNWIIASLDIDKAFLQGFTYCELAEATGEKERVVCFRPCKYLLTRRMNAHYSVISAFRSLEKDVPFFRNGPFINLIQIESASINFNIFSIRLFCRKTVILGVLLETIS